MLFFKYYEPAKEKVYYMGHMYVGITTKLSNIGKIIYYYYLSGYWVSSGGLKLVGFLAKTEHVPMKLLHFIDRHNAEWTKILESKLPVY